MMNTASSSFIHAIAMTYARTAARHADAADTAAFIAVRSFGPNKAARFARHALTAALDAAACAASADFEVDDSEIGAGLAHDEYRRAWISASRAADAAALAARIRAMTTGRKGHKAYATRLERLAADITANTPAEY